MKGRVYDPLTARFLTPDPVMQAPYFSQGLNRYSYAFNDPVNNVDPSGFDVDWTDQSTRSGAAITGWAAGVGIGAGFSMLAQTGAGVAAESVLGGALGGGLNIAQDLFFGLPGGGSPARTISVTPTASPTSAGTSMQSPQATGQNKGLPPVVPNFDVPARGPLLAENGPLDAGVPDGGAPDASIGSPPTASDGVRNSEPSWFERVWNGLKNIGQGVFNEVRDIAKAPILAAQQSVPPLYLRPSRFGLRLHGKIPTSDVLRQATSDDLVELRDMTDISIDTREKEMLNIGAKGGHGNRIGDERRLLKTIVEILRGRGIQ